MMNDILLKKVEHKASTYSNLGDSVLRIMQNETMEVLELLVREVIQNSLDAGIKNKDVIMDFKIQNFESKKVLNIIEGLNEDFFFKKFSENNQKQIIISDKNTTGLTGDANIYNDRNSNLYKLVYNVGQRQEKEGSGGSWGYGKTVYYRIGIGLVLFYSRIKNDKGFYEERLALSLIENQNNPIKVALTESRDYTGINLWGETVSREEGISTLPVTSSEKISKILEAFNITPYNETETGTLISIPFINEEELINNVNIGDGYHYHDLEDFFFNSIQRWYAPRLNNEYYNYGNKNNLIVYINNEKLKYEEQDKFFKLVNGMYIYATTNNDEIIKKEFPNVDVFKEEMKVQSYRINGMVGDKVGDFIYALVHYNDLGMMNHSDLKNPYTLSNNYIEDYNGDKTNSPIIMMTRQPGMIVQYDTNGQWVHRMMHTPIEEYIIGLFVLNSSNETYFKTDDNIKLTLEEYIRSGEKSDHLNWEDRVYRYERKIVSPKIIDKTIKNIVTKVNDKLKVIEEYDETTSTTHLQNIFGQTIMPPEGFGNTSTRTSRSNTISNRFGRMSKFAEINFDYQNVNYKINEILIPFEIRIISEMLKNIKIQLSIQTETGVINISRFEERTGNKSPITIKKIIFEKNNLNLERTLKIPSTSLVVFENNDKIFKKGDIIIGEIVLNNFDKNIVPILRSEIKGDDINE